MGLSADVLQTLRSNYIGRQVRKFGEDERGTVNNVLIEDGDLCFKVLYRGGFRNVKQGDFENYGLEIQEPTRRLVAPSSRQ